MTKITVTLDVEVGLEFWRQDGTSKPTMSAAEALQAALADLRQPDSYQFRFPGATVTSAAAVLDLDKQ
jgi:hypothetical protein